MPTLALVAATREELLSKVMQPLLDGFRRGSVAIVIPEDEQPIAKAVMEHMWREAQPTECGATSSHTFAQVWQKQVVQNKSWEEYGMSTPSRRLTHAWGWVKSCNTSRSQRQGKSTLPKADQVLPGLEGRR